MAINFPDSPTIGDEFAGGGFTWTWNGSSWEKVVAAGGANDFLLDKNNTDNTTFPMDREYAAGGYSMSFDTVDSTFDVYLLNSSGTVAGYSNTVSIVAEEAFDTVVVLGTTSSQKISFTYNGPFATAETTGDEPGAGPFLTDITPSDLPNIDDTATITGGNFANDVEINFVGTNSVSLPAKDIVHTSSTELIVTRPDGLVEDFSPYDLIATNPGVPSPSGSGLNILTDAVTAGADPVWVTGNLITGLSPNTAFSSFIEATDAEGDVTYSITSGSLHSGLSLNSSTGEISGTTSADGAIATFTVRATDEGGNFSDRTFDLPAGCCFLGGTSNTSGGYLYATFTNSDTLTVVNGGSTTIEYLIVAGGGSGGSRSNDWPGNGGGGGGGYIAGSSILASDDYTIVVGSGAAAVSGNVNGIQGGNSSAFSLTATGGGYGGSIKASNTGGNGGSGGGGSYGGAGGSPVSGQGFGGGNGHAATPDDTAIAGGGGGGSQAGFAGGIVSTTQGKGGDGYTWVNGVVYAGGGAGGRHGYGSALTQSGGSGGGGSSGSPAVAGTDGLGGGGGAGNSNGSPKGGDGVVIVRRAV